MSERGTIADLFRIPTRFQRSVQLERDFNDPHALEDYIVTEPMARAFQRVADGLRPGSGRRAWRVTGDYGVGKSSFALVLAHLLAQSGGAVERIAEAAGWPLDNEALPRLWPVLVTGRRESPVRAIAAGFAEALANRQGKAKNRLLADLRVRAEGVARTGELRDLEDLVERVRDMLDAQGMGILLIVDELGKCLEHAGQQTEPEDVFVLQWLAELAARSGDRPFVFLGLLHQGFSAYGARLPSTVRQEWDKIAGRFDEILFDQALAHTAALVAGALGVETKRLTPAISRAARSSAEATAIMGWLGGATSGAVTLDAAPLYPVHPTLLPPLARFFARFGQHERSLFGFLLSDEPSGLQAFAARAPGDTTWYGLPEFYDYVRAAYGHRLTGESYQNHWLRISAAVSAAEGLSPLELRVIKAIALLNLIDAEDLLPTDRALRACLTPATARDVDAALATIIDRGLLHRRGAHGGYRLWPNTSVNLQAVLARATRELPDIEGIGEALIPFVDQEPLLARRHYIETGTLRYFEVRYAPLDAMARVLDKPTTADGLVIVALSDSPEEREAELRMAADAPFATRPDVVVGVGQPLGGLQAELLDLKRWLWVEENTPELAHDGYAAEEVSRQIAMTKRALAARVGQLSGLRGRGEGMTWLRLAKPWRPERNLTAALSSICDERFKQAPLVANELINRNVLSSAAAAARMRLIERLFDRSDEEAFGLDVSKAPPERSIYLSVLTKGGLHAQDAGVWRLRETPPADDPLRLAPALGAILRVLADAQGDRVPVLAIFERLRAAPFGVRDGLAPLLLAYVLKTRAHDLAVYENGTFVAAFGPADFMRLTKKMAAFELQLCEVSGVRAEVFARLARVFARGVDARRPDILDVVRPLCEFAAALPEYTRRAGGLSPLAVNVRDALLKARDPAKLLFHDLPVACGHAAFEPGGAPDARAIAFVTDLQTAHEDLQSAYSCLVGRIVANVSTAIGQHRTGFDRAALASRAARVSLAAREPRLRTFALRLRDPGTSDEAWAEALASFVVARPPKRWGPGDEARFNEEIGALAEVFHKVEAAAFGAGDDRPALDAVRLNLTRGDGGDLVHVLHPEQLDNADERDLEALRQRLPQARGLRLQFLTTLLWRELQPEDLPAPVLGQQSTGGDQ